MRTFLTAALAASLLAAAPFQSPALAEAPASTAPASPQDLVAKVDIPFERFVLDNGLTTIVHTDRKAPIVGVTIYYRIGSKHETRGRTGFAHLYEHLFFAGSANVENFDKPLEAAGSTATNGSTWYDRTNYVETVPSGALELALFMESDRMGYLLPAVTQDKLDKQRDVVKNEKRQGDNQPYGLMDYAVSEGLFPVGHPYRHATIGSMADLEAATLADVRNWFRDHYGPNNAVLVLTGDIDAATARPLVEKWFGAIPRGPEVPKLEAGPVTLAAPAAREMTDRVPVIRLTRYWSGPGINDRDVPALQIGMHILGGLASSRLDNQLVRGEEIAVAVTASASVFEQVSFLGATMDVKPGIDRARAEKRFEAVIAGFLAEGPTEDEVRRAVTSTLSAEIGALERVGGFGGKGATLAEGELYSGDPARFRENLKTMAALTPDIVRSAMRRWLSRPVFALNVTPGERSESGETMGGWGDEAGRPPPARDRREAAPSPPTAPEREAPPVAPVLALDFPEIEHARLSNGVPVSLARRTAIPKVIVALDFDAGYAADALDAPGTQALMLDLIDEGAGGRDATQIAEEQERLGADISIGGAIDSSRIALTALTANLGPSLALMADIVRDPAFAPADVVRVRGQQLAQLSQVLASPDALARRELGMLLFGGHPYAQPEDGLGHAASIARLTSKDLRAAHRKWLRPDLLRIAVAGDVTLAELLPRLEAAFGNWQAPAGPKPAKNLAAAVPPAAARIVLIDRPDSPQSVIAAGRVLPVSGSAKGMEALAIANEVLGGGFLSRLNTKLREEKGWSYGVYSAVSLPVGPRDLSIAAPVQTDRTGETIATMLSVMRDFVADKPATQEELSRVIEGSIRSLPSSFETNAGVLGAMLRNERLGRPDDYYETLADTYRGLGSDEIEHAAKRFLEPGGLAFVVVGDRRQVEPQLRKLGLPLEIREAKE